MKSIKNIFLMSLVLTGTLVTSKSYSKPIFLNSELDFNKCSVSSQKNLNKVNSKAFNYITQIASSVLGKNENLVKDSCNDNPLSDYQNPIIPSKFTSVFEDNTLELRLQPGDSISKVIHEKSCQQAFGKITNSNLPEVGKARRNLLQNSNCDFTIGTIEEKNTLEVSAKEKYSRAYKTKEIELIAKTIWGEGRGESYEGKVAIGNVIVNRYKISQATKRSDWWGNTIEQIILHPYQFSCHNHNDPNKAKIAKLNTNDYHYRESLKIANGILSGTIKDNTMGATHYFAYKIVRPRWASNMKKTKRIGNHDFYKK